MNYSSTARLSSPTLCTLYTLVGLCWQLMQHFFIVFTIWFSIVNITAATKMNIAPKTSIAAGTVFVIAIWAINANTISDVLRVETIVGEMNSKDFKNSQNPNIPVTSNKWNVAIILNNLVMGIPDIVIKSHNSVVMIRLTYAGNCNAYSPFIRCNLTDVSSEKPILFIDECT